MGHQSEDRRKNVRVAGAILLFVSHSSKNGVRQYNPTNQHAQNALLLDLSPAGISFVTKENLSLNSSILVGFQTEQNNLWWLDSKIIWRDPFKNRYGAHFINSTKEATTVLESILQQIGKTFIYDRGIYLTDTNAEGNAYFAAHFDWQGETREAYLKKSITMEEYILMTKSRTRLLTVKAYLEYHKPLWLFNETRIRMTTRNIHRLSLEMVFTYFNKFTAELVAEGYQKLAFQDKRSNLILIPPFIRRIANLIETQPSSHIENIAFSK